MLRAVRQSDRVIRPDAPSNCRISRVRDDGVRETFKDFQDRRTTREDPSRIIRRTAIIPARFRDFKACAPSILVVYLA